MLHVQVAILIAVGFLTTVFVSEVTIQIALDVALLAASSLFTGLHGHFNSVVTGQLRVYTLVFACFVV